MSLNLAVILGSAREGRFGPVVANWLVGQAEQHGQFAVDLIDVAETPLPTALPPGSEALRDIGSRAPELIALSGRLAAADAFLIVTPEYNHSFPASLKHLIDWHFDEWQAKPVGFVSYGGHGGGVRAVEQLRLVFAELHAVTVRDTVTFDRFWERFTANGELIDADGAPFAAKVLLDQLLWWGTALRDARRAKPYVA
jgi:NAD(P)H-dependent FMN reductase